MVNGSLREPFGIYMDTWDVDGRHNLSVWMACGNSHFICLVFFTHTKVVLAEQPFNYYIHLSGKYVL